MTSPNALQSPWPKQRDRNREREEKREAVLLAAVKIFNEKGFYATSLDDVAERLNVTKPTLYYYVKSKDEILYECVRIGLQMIKDAIAEATALGGTALDRLTAAMRQYAIAVTMDFGMCLIRVGEEPLPSESKKRLRGLKAEIDDEFRSLIEQGISEGYIAPVNPKIAAFALAGTLSWIGRWYQSGGLLAPEEIADQCISLLLNGLMYREHPQSFE